MYRIEVSRLRDKSLSDKYTCPLCHNVLFDAVMRPNCNHTFCRQCISEYLREHSSCPVDESPLTVNYLANLTPAMRDQLNEVEIKCKYHANGCSRWVKYAHLLHHEDICLFKKIDINVHRAQFDQMLRSRLILSTGVACKGSNSYMVKLLKILEEKEALVKQQEQLISAIIDESDQMTRLMAQMNTSDSSLSDAVDTIAKLEEENKLLRQRVSLNQDKLVNQYRMPRSQTAFDTRTLTSVNFISDRATSALEGKNYTEAMNKFNDASSSSLEKNADNCEASCNLLSESSACSALARSPSARYYHVSSRSKSGRTTQSSYGVRSSDKSRATLHRPSSASTISPKRTVRRGSYCSTNFSSRITSATVEHLDVVRRLRPRLSDALYRAIQVVDLADFYDFDPYQLTWAAYVADRIKRFAVNLKEGSRVLLVSGWNDLYIAVVLSTFVGSKGLLVTRSSIPVFASASCDVDRINRHHRCLLQDRQLVLLPYETPNFTSVGYSEASPYDVIFIASSMYTRAIDSQRAVDTGLVFDPYENRDITGQCVESTTTSPSIHVASDHSSSSLSGRSADDVSALLLNCK